MICEGNLFQKKVSLALLSKRLWRYFCTKGCMRHVADGSTRGAAPHWVRTYVMSVRTFYFCNKNTLKVFEWGYGGDLFS